MGKNGDRKGRKTEVRKRQVSEQITIVGSGALFFIDCLSSSGEGRILSPSTILGASIPRHFNAANFVGTGENPLWVAKQRG